MSHDDFDVVTISLFDKKVEGAIRCLGETCCAYKIPRSLLKEYTDMEDLKKAGIYFIYGKSEGEFKIYVGQTEVRKNGKGLLNRVQEHDKPKDNYWNMAIMLFRTTSPLDAADLNYLENYFEDVLRKLYGDNCQNGVSPHNSGVTPEKESKLKRFIKEVDINTQLLGCTVIPHSEINEKTQKNKPIQSVKQDVLFDSLCQEIETYISNSWKDMEVVPQKHYIAYKYHGENVICLEKLSGKKSIYLYMKLNPDDYNLVDGFSADKRVRDMRGIGHYATGDLRIEIKDTESLLTAKKWVNMCVSKNIGD